METYYLNNIGTLIYTYLFMGIFTYWLEMQLRLPEISAQRDNGWVYDQIPDLPLPDVQSPVYLIQLAYYEAYVNHALQELRNQSNLQLQAEPVEKIEQYLLAYKNEMSRADLSEISVEDKARIVSKNPILTLNMIWRFTYDLPAIFEQLRNQPFFSRVKFVLTNENAFAKWPNIYTLKEAMIGFFRIQLVYDINVDELAAGQIFGFETGARISIPMMYELGKYARSKGMYSLAVPWFELTLQEMYVLIVEQESKSMNFEFSHPQVEIQLQQTMMQHDIKWQDHQFWQTYQYLYNDLLLNKNYEPVNDRLPIRKLDFSELRRLSGKVHHDEINYWSLCSGSNHQTEQEKSELFCWYDTTTDPALTIYPIKKELLSSSPYVVQLYNLLTDATVKKLVEWSEPRLERSTIVDEHMNPGGCQLAANIRTSVEAVMDKHERFSNDLGKLLEIVSGLSVVPPSSAEPFLIASYSFGGHYSCHLDAYEDSSVPVNDGGNRIATMMFYLDDTPVGGFTAFPQAGIAVKPSKGSALFWYNLKRSGEQDLTTGHCACPVVLGHKTISTKWIRYNDQLNSHPCGLHKDDVYAPFPEIRDYSTPLYKATHDLFSE